MAGIDKEAKSPTSTYIKELNSILKNFNVKYQLKLDNTWGWRFTQEITTTKIEFEI
ncbi:MULTISPECIES: hypothetical protein [unclassified Pseudoalteromonas]|uniref:hypothetical protein n=1 Tax=unclassified Pseudoalteromonas TaxID=194690 RepID=UPI000B1C7268|nr:MULTISPECIES: hypothetical protein [unclassified Pseudoalteromonas]